ncbi:rhodanese-like domain-containing protein [Glutamicibacter sp. MNS18]|uniref:rhodanese-like domain-containing protein n=1 Tax=Glutamicibacter sp. MNS18 TaxID=2989817 RepID=UPI003531A715
MPGSLHIPLEQILQCGWDALDVHGVGGEVVIVCKSGVRSQRAARTLLLERPATTVSSLRGGTVEWFARIRGSELVY